MLVSTPAGHTLHMINTAGRHVNAYLDFWYHGVKNGIFCCCKNLFFNYQKCNCNAILVYFCLNFIPMATSFAPL